MAILRVIPHLASISSLLILGNGHYTHVLTPIIAVSFYHVCESNARVPTSLLEVNNEKTSDVHDQIGWYTQVEEHSRNEPYLVS